MNRADFLALVTAAPIAPASGAMVRAEITIKRDSDDLLAPFSVSIAVRNLTSHAVGLDFPTADIYRIDVERDDHILWSTATGHKPLLIARRVELGPGITRLASQVIDGTTDDRRSFAPGSSTVHVALLGRTLTTTLDKTLAFTAPLSIAEARKLGAGPVMTIAGIPRSASGVFTLLDATGSIRLSRPLGLHPTGTYIVRGVIETVDDEAQFAVARYAPAFDNGADTAPVSPTPSASAPSRGKPILGRD